MIKIISYIKRRIADFNTDGLTFSRTTLTIFCVAIYFLGCLLATFGIPKALWNLVIHQQWVYEPEYDFFGSLYSSLAGVVSSLAGVVVNLIYAAVALAYPVLCLWVVFILPLLLVAIIVGGWCCIVDFIKFFKRLVNKGKEN
jgi:hypothetical protein